MHRGSLILGIETSCDETAAAVVEDGVRVRSNVIASQHDLHAEFRGVVPEIASRAHAERVLPVFRKALSRAGVSKRELTAVAVGNRPGLIGSLLVGVAAAKATAWGLNLPLVGIDHVHAHLYAGSLETGDPLYPALGLVVSGGHTALYRVGSPVEVERLGATIDDAVGEAFDKVAAILELPYPGGPNLDKLAADGDASAHDFPVSRLGRDSLDFSFSGLKTAVLYAVRGVPGKRDEEGAGRPTLDRQRRADIAASFQRAAVRAVLLKLERALEQHPECRSLVVGGGVSANSLLRAEVTRLAKQRALELRLPRMEYCLDNAAMIAGLAHHVLIHRDGRGDDLTLAAEPTTAC